MSILNPRHWLRTLTRRRNRGTNTTVARRPFVPRLRRLEDRVVPNAYLVTNLEDSGVFSLRDALSSANAHPGPDEIRCADNLSGTINLNSEPLRVTDDLTISGPGPGLLALSGGGHVRVLDVANGATVSLSGLTISDGYTTGSGGGILVESGSSLSLDHVLLANNRATYGGAIENAGRLSISACSFTKNSAGGFRKVGAGGAIDSSGPLLWVSDSRFVYNLADGGDDGTGRGGAIRVHSGQEVFLSRCAFTNNTASGGYQAGGGAIVAELSNLALADCTFLSNQSGGNTMSVQDAAGGAIMAVGSNLSISDSLFRNNLARGGDRASRILSGLGAAEGGAIFSAAVTGFSRSSLTVNNSTFLGNRVVGGNSQVGPGGNAAGGAIDNTHGSDLSVSGSTFDGNAAVGGAGGPGSTGGNGLGGAIANDGSPLLLSDSLLVRNSAQGADGGTGGNGCGGGLWVGAGSAATIWKSSVVANWAGGGSYASGPNAGQGLGGGVYVDPRATVMVDQLTQDRITGSHASAKDDNVSGVLWKF